MSAPSRSLFLMSSSPSSTSYFHPSPSQTPRTPPRSPDAATELCVPAPETSPSASDSSSSSSTIPSSMSSSLPSTTTITTSLSTIPSSSSSSSSSASRKLADSSDSPCGEWLLSEDEDRMVSIILEGRTLSEDDEEGGHIPAGRWSQVVDPQELELKKNYQSHSRRKSLPRRFEQMQEPEWTLLDTLEKVIRKPAELAHIRRHLTHLHFEEVNPKLGRALSRRVDPPLPLRNRDQIVRQPVACRKFPAMAYRGRGPRAQRSDQGTSQQLLVGSGRSKIKIGGEIVQGQWVLARRAEGELFHPALVTKKLEHDSYETHFGPNDSLVLNRSHLIVSSSTDFIYGSELPFGQQVLARCQDGFFYQATVIKRESSLLYSLQFRDGDPRPPSRREEIFVEGEQDIGTFRLSVFQRIYARWCSAGIGKENPKEEHRAPAMVTSVQPDGSYTVMFGGNCSRVLWPKDITLSWKGFDW